MSLDRSFPESATDCSVLFVNEIEIDDMIIVMQRRSLFFFFATDSTISNYEMIMILWLDFVFQKRKISFASQR